MTRLVFRLCLAAAAGCLAVLCILPSEAADPAESPRVRATREKMLPAKLKLDVDKKMLRAIINSDLPDAVKEATKLDIKIMPAPGTAAVTLTSSFELKGEMTLEEVLNKICEEKGWGWYVNVAKPGDQKDGAIFLTGNPKERGYKEGTGPKEHGKKEVAKKDEPKGKAKAKEEPKNGDSDKDAAELLTRAKFLVATKQTEKAKAALKEVIDKFPDSKQAADAKKILEKISK